MNNFELYEKVNIHIQELPVQVSSPLYRLCRSESYFKRLHLVSDVLLGCFRLYGHALIKIAKIEDSGNNGIEQSIEKLLAKDSHGLWSTTIAKLISQLDEQQSPQLSAELATLFGVNIKSIKQPPIRKMTVKNTVIDSKGQNNSWRSLTHQLNY